MKRKITQVLPPIEPALLNKPPHILRQLLDQMLGERKPTSLEQEQLIEHLIGCINCQVALRIIVEIKLNADGSKSYSKTAIQQLLSQLQDIIFQTLKQDRED